MQPGEINVDPIEGEFFTTEAVGSINDALVRESIQNSLDAAIDSAPVTVRFSFCTGIDETSDSQAAIDRYLDGLGPHIESKHAGLSDIPGQDDPIDYILIEDFGTSGLQGDMLQYDDLEDDIKKNDFYFFWRNIGRTRKGDTDLGRWGLGKTVFQAASRINSFFGLTIRNDDGRLLLMGQSVLKIHKVNNKRYNPYGYFGCFDRELSIPVEDQKIIDAFSSCFHCDRKDKPGLSVIIPYPDKDLKTSDCMKSVIRHYFFPILAGRLIVEMVYDTKHYRLDAQTLYGYLKKSDWPEKQGLLGLLELARWSIRVPEEEFIRLSEPIPGHAPKLREELFSPKVLEIARKKFSEVTRMAFQVPVSVQRQSDKKVMKTGFSVFLERDDNLQKAEDYFIRQGITIPEVTSLKHKGVRAIVSITDRELSTFLGDAENPAHTEWERNSKKFKKKYRLGPSTLDFVKTSPRELVKILTQPRKGRDENLLKHLFSLTLASIEPKKDQPLDMEGKGDKKNGAEDLIHVEDKNRLQLTPKKGGFRLKRRPKAMKIPKYITVWMAYEVRSGNPFKKYTPFDFDAGQPPITIDLHGAKLLLKKENVIQIEVQKGDFYLSVKGFDIHRDLRVKIYP